MEQATIAMATGETVSGTPEIKVPDAIPTTEIPPSSSAYESGGVMNRIGDFKIVEYLMFALFMSASIYSIYYHRQALNKLNE